MSDVLCPYCQGPTHIQFRKGGKGKFHSCDRFPECRGAVAIPDEKPQPPGPEMHPKFRADGALAIALKMIENWQNVRVKDDKMSIAEHSVKLIDEIIDELQK